MERAIGRTGAGTILAALLVWAAGCPRAFAADVSNLPPFVRMMLQCVEIDWGELGAALPAGVSLTPRPLPDPASLSHPSAPETVSLGLQTLPAPTGRPADAQPVRVGEPVDLHTVGLDRKPIALPGAQAAGVVTPGEHGAGATAPVGAVGTPVGVTAAAPLPDLVAGSALNDARRNVLAGLAARGNLSARDWKQKILDEKLTFEDMCVVWHQFRRDHPQEGESPRHTRPVWHGARDALGLADVDITTLPTPQLFVLAEMQLYPGETEGAERCLREILDRLEGGEPPGPRVTRGLVAYRIAQCYRQRGESEEAIKWFLKCADWGAPTETNRYDVRGEGLVEAGRLLARMGNKGEAEREYRKAVDSTDGWGKVVAILDLSGFLRKRGDEAESVALLTQLADGSYGPVAQAIACLFLAQRRYEEGDAVETREYLTRVLEITAAAQDPGTTSRLAGTRSTATGMLQELERWEKQPVQAYPQAVVLSAKRDAAEIMVRTWRATPSVRSDATWLKVEAVAAPDMEGGVTHHRYRVSIPDGSPERTMEASVLIAAVNAGEHEPVRATVTAIGAPTITVTPREFFFGLVNVGERARQEVIVKLPEPFVVSAAQSDHDDIEVSAPERTQDGWRITAAMASQTAGVVRGAVTVLTDMPDREVIRVPTYVHVQAE